MKQLKQQKCNVLKIETHKCIVSLIILLIFIKNNDCLQKALIKLLKKGGKTFLSKQWQNIGHIKENKK